MIFNYEKVIANLVAAGFSLRKDVIMSEIQTKPMHP